MSDTQPSPLLIVISAPSGGGKTTLEKQLLAAYPGMARAVTCTTRPPREGGGRAVVGYDFWHKGNPAGPVVMGLCRALVYAGAAAAAIGSVPPIVVVTALAMLAYVAGITYAAQQESYDRVGRLWPLAALAAPAAVALVGLARSWLVVGAVVLLAAWTSAAVSVLVRRPAAGAVSRAVSWLIAGISLVDAAFIAGADALAPVALAVLGFAATLVAQRYVAGT